jgi:hypothetical protein
MSASPPWQLAKHTVMHTVYTHTPVDRLDAQQCVVTGASRASLALRALTLRAPLAVGDAEHHAQHGALRTACESTHTYTYDAARTCALYGVNTSTDRERNDGSRNICRRHAR